MKYWLDHSTVELQLFAERKLNVQTKDRIELLWCYERKNVSR